jgi:Tol biopolymer transport system component
MKVPVAIAVACLTACAAAITTPGASSAASERAARALAGCSYGKRVGEAFRTSRSVRIGSGFPEKAELRRGMWVLTGSGGSAELCLTLGRALCLVGPNSAVLVYPRKPRTNAPVLRVSRAHAEIRCSISGRTHIAAAGQAIRFQQPSRALADRDREAAATGGAVFSFSVRRRTVEVKMWRGSAVVSRLATTRGGVVVASAPPTPLASSPPKYRVVAKPGQNPEPPKVFRPTAPERAAFRRVEAPLRPEQDKTPPAVSLVGPSNPSSLRTAVFRFRSSEPGTVFTCSLDDAVFRVCQSPRTELVGPGMHRFRARATDPAGNSRTATYVWTVDASRIAFASERNGNPDIYTVEVDGTQERRLTTDLGADEAPEWSPDLSRIAFHRRDRGTDILVVDADGTNERRVVASGATDRNPTWAPDGRRLAFESDRSGSLEIYVVDLESGAVTQLMESVGANFDPAWSPDGSRIAFASTRDGNEEVYVMNADGSAQRRLTVNPGPDFNPAWSADNSTLAFHSRRGSVQHIYTVDASGGAAVQLTNGPTNDHNPAWSPQSEAIVFQRELASVEGPPPMTIYYVLADGSRPTRLVTTPGNHYDPDW